MHYNVHYKYLYNAFNRNALSVTLHLIVNKINIDIRNLNLDFFFFFWYLRYILKFLEMTFSHHDLFKSILRDSILIITLTIKIIIMNILILIL